MTQAKYYALEKDEKKKCATLDIFGDVTSWPGADSDVSNANLSKELDSLGDVENITVRINSYGGEVAEGLAIYNSLRKHKATITTECYGFACSIASVIFMAGDIRRMNKSSLLMIHNAWTCGAGNASELRKVADDLDTINDAAVAAYMDVADIDEAKVRELMDAESWIKPADALEYGFATTVEGDEKSDKPSQSARSRIMQLVLAATEEEEPEEEEEVDVTDEDKTTEEAAEEIEIEEEPEEDTSEEEETEEAPEEEPEEEDTEADDSEENKDNTDEEEEDADEAKDAFMQFLTALAK